MSTTPARRLATIVAVAAITAAACGGADEPATGPGTPTTDAPTTQAPDTAAPVTTVSDGADAAPGATEPADVEPDVDAPEILQLSAPLVGGGELDLAPLADRPVLLWFWAPF